MNEIKEGVWYTHDNAGYCKFAHGHGGLIIRLVPGLGWFESQSTPSRREMVSNFMGREASKSEIGGALIQEAKRRELWGDTKLKFHADGLTYGDVINKDAFVPGYLMRKDKLCNDHSVIYHDGCWAEPLEEPLNKNQKMENEEIGPSLSREQLVALYHRFTCDEWRAKIQYYLDLLKYDSDFKRIELRLSDLDYASKNATDAQKAVLSDLGINLERDKNAFVKKFSSCHYQTRSLSRLLFNDPNVIDISDGAEKNVGRPDLQGRAFFINRLYEVRVHTCSPINGTVIEITKK